MIAKIVIDWLLNVLNVAWAWASKVADSNSGYEILFYIFGATLTLMGLGLISTFARMHRDAQDDSDDEKEKILDNLESIENTMGIQIYLVYVGLYFLIVGSYSFPVAVILLVPFGLIAALKWVGKKLKPILLNALEGILILTKPK